MRWLRFRFRLGDVQIAVKDSLVMTVVTIADDAAGEWWEKNESFSLSSVPFALAMPLAKCFSFPV